LISSGFPIFQGLVFLQDFRFSNLSYSTAEPLFTKQLMFGYILTRIRNQIKQIKLFRWLGMSFGSQKRIIFVYMFK